MYIYIYIRTYMTCIRTYMHVCMHACMHKHTHTCAVCCSYTKLKYVFVVVALLLQYTQLACCCRALFTMSDDELSTARQLSNASSEGEQIIRRFTNPLTSETYFTKPLKFDERMSVGFLFHIVKSEFGNCRKAQSWQAHLAEWRSGFLCKVLENPICQGCTWCIRGP